MRTNNSLVTTLPGLNLTMVTREMVTIATNVITSTVATGISAASITTTDHITTDHITTDRIMIGPTTIRDINRIIDRETRTSFIDSEAADFRAPPI